MDSKLRDYTTAPLFTHQKSSFLGADTRLLFLQQLQGKLDLYDVFQIFTQEIDKYIDVSKLSWHFDNECALIKSTDMPKYHTYCFSLSFDERVLGELHYQTPYTLEPEEQTLLHHYHRLFAGSLNNALEFRRIKKMALRDHLSDLGNRACFEQDIHHALAISERRAVGLTLVIFDLDNFKQVNDRYGHLNGDKVIRSFSKALKESVRASDRCYRLGGDEFIALLQPSTEQSAEKVTLRVIEALSIYPILQHFNIGTSFGYANYHDGDTSASLIERADRRLYYHKRNK
ncbi:GGDEF domain-containing protein [Photobacterium damselae]|uniref:GGDEF domain-containing protein n=1 Tax=Photobacterium damselae TaxID=38293 RepID=UPI004068692D